jgi:hypothetical protein
MHLGTAIFLIFLIWLFIAFPAVRMLVGILAVIAGLAFCAMVQQSSPPRPPPMTAEQRAEQDRLREEMRQKEAARWAKVKPEEITVKATFSTPCYGDCTHYARYVVKNSSSEPISAFKLSVVAYNCRDKPDAAFSGCDVVGRNERTVSVQVPPSEVREFRGDLNFPNAAEPDQGWARLFRSTVTAVQAP